MGGHQFEPGSDDVALALGPRPDARVINQDIYTGVTPALISMLAEADVDTVNICGIAAENCTLKTAFDLFESGLRPGVLAAAGGHQLP